MPIIQKLTTAASSRRWIRLLLYPYRPSLFRPLSGVQDRLEDLENGAAGATLVILIGIVFEAIAEFLPPEDHTHLTLALLGNSLVCVGLLHEFLTTRATIVDSREEHRESDLKVAEANRAAAEAVQKANEAALELAKYREPRQFTRDQMYRLAGKLKPFSGVRYAGATVGREPEYRSFLEYIEAALMLANWQEIDCDGEPATPRSAGRTSVGTSVSLSNVLITFPVNEAGSKLETAAVALADSLKEEGFIAQAGLDYGSTPGVIRVMVGPKT